jgi:DNA-binding PucR family transcriptional regulator
MPPEGLGAALDGVGCILVPDPGGPGRAAALANAVAGGPHAALGPGGPVGALGESWSLARRALRAAEGGAIPGDGLVAAEDHLGVLLLFEGRDIGRRIAARRLEPLEALTPRSRRRMMETALAYVSHRGSAAAMAEALHVHPQTARYRITRLRELFGSQLEDPDDRFELEIALRLFDPEAPA